MSPEGQEEKALRVYEVGYHLVPTIEETKLEGAVNELRSVIEKAGGSFIAEGAPALMKLAYPMSLKEGEKRAEYDRGYFGWIKFEAPTSAAEEVGKQFGEKPYVLRRMLFETVREDTRAKIKMPLREVKRTDTIKTTPRREETVASEPISEEDLNKAIETLTSE